VKIEVFFSLVDFRLAQSATVIASGHVTPVCSIKGEVKKKYLSAGWIFSCFTAHSIERDLF
jgi:hypothetical protein